MREFKVGDWVTIIWHKEKSPHQITGIWEGDSTDNVNCTYDESSSIFFDSCTDCTAKDCILWKPKANEWCMFWNSDYAYPQLLQSNGTHVNNHFFTKTGVPIPSYDEGGVDIVVCDMWEFCEPFIGQLPSLKEQEC